MLLSRRARLLGAALALALGPVTAAILALALALPAAPALAEDPPAPPASAGVKVTWFGQACFELEFPTGLVVLLDPFEAEKIGSYRFPSDVRPDVVTISHEHFDHNNDKAVAGKPQVLRGLTSGEKDKQDWNKHDLVVKGVHIRSVPLYHDEKNGAERGKNAAFVFEPEKKGAFATICHLGDLGHALTDEQQKAIGPVDAVLVPVGGHFTIDAAGAKKVCDALAARRAIVPMHYKTPSLKPELPLATADEFLRAYEGRVVRVEGNQETIQAGKSAGEAKVLVLGYEPKAALPDAGKEKAVPEHDVHEYTGRVAVDGRAWVDAMPGPGRGRPLHVTLEITATPGPRSGGGVVTVSAFADVANKKIPLELEEDAGAAVPKDGWTVKAGETRKVNLVAKDGQAGSVGDRIHVCATLKPRAPEDPTVEPESDDVFLLIQDVR